ncbi:hypothetical protein Sjap_025778 [Stephania japonica]|uniref:Protein NUCLEAR FUSION DEFECTIVE 6, chloroplastic/mitochondrial-like n=1 Tax=Stephania japonica TaxID=461633 RepID=A0AAP0E6R6_9MAGN
MSIASSSIRSALLRSTLSSAASAKAARSPFRLSNQTSLARRTLSYLFDRCPVEMSCCVESLMPFHNATSSALLISMLSVTRRAYGWVPEGNCWF